MILSLERGGDSDRLIALFGVLRSQSFVVGSSWLLPFMVKRESSDADLQLDRQNQRAYSFS